ncbi:glycogen phosphorylase muscle form [Clonorchis sinensis]|uniref:Alpha-1,4 glucan phosphorylase n=1 Tax=Clonorchis sinensis TaxID=79923 RepID=G7YRK1_CLOSI|nr:glycogen phosphorylase muscle form [Clonorchis sinensis]
MFINPLKTRTQMFTADTLFTLSTPSLRFRAIPVIQLLCVIIIIIDSMTSVFNTDASMPYNHDLFESLIVKKRIKLNGALTIGTMDGANVEMCEEMGRENMFVFGLTVDEVDALHKKGYRPGDYIEKNPELKLCLEQIRDGYFSPENPQLFTDIYNSLVFDDRFLLCADYADYMHAQKEVEVAYKDETRWARMMLMNIASSGKFSSDRTIRDYARDIWGVEPSTVKLPPPFEPVDKK